MIRGLRKNILGIWGERSFFFQGAESKDPPPWGPLYYGKQDKSCSSHTNWKMSKANKSHFSSNFETFSRGPDKPERPKRGSYM